MGELREPQPGEIVAEKYRLTRQLGRGGMGSVWEGVHQTLNSRVAVKFIDAQFVEDDEIRQRFFNEAIAAARLKSKHVVQVYDHGVTADGRPYMVMEFLEGENLETRLENAGPMSLDALCQVLVPLGRALEQAHVVGIIHRDLKPENIFLVWDNEDQRDLVKIVDFGIAKLTENSGTTKATRTGIFLGTPSYMSPEQARGLASVDARTDVWSLGVITYECLSGQMPFVGQAIGDLLLKICTMDPTPVSQLSQLPPGIDAWMARSLARNPDDRFPSVEEQIRALLELVRPSLLPPSLSMNPPSLSTNPPSQSTNGLPQSHPSVASSPSVESSPSVASSLPAAGAPVSRAQVPGASAGLEAPRAPLAEAQMEQDAQATGATGAGLALTMSTEDREFALRLARKRRALGLVVAAVSVVAGGALSAVLLMDRGRSTEVGHQAAGLPLADAPLLATSESTVANAEASPNLVPQVPTEHAPSAVAGPSATSTSEPVGAGGAAIVAAGSTAGTSGSQKARAPTRTLRASKRRRVSHQKRPAKVKKTPAKALPKLPGAGIDKPQPPTGLPGSGL